jgi:soluble lytic murein transglycosylase-like protein
MHGGRLAPMISLRRVLVGAASALAVGGLVIAGSALAGDTMSGAQTLQYSVRQPLSDSDARTLGSLLEAAKRGDALRIRVDMDGLSDPMARKIALWALIETNPEGLSYAELDGARRDLAGWPGSAGREAAAEKVLEGGGLGPKATIDWFAGADPVTAPGAMALAAAYQAMGQSAKASDVIRHLWRTRPFDTATQNTVQSRFGMFITTDDQVVRSEMLTSGPDTQGRMWRLRKPQVIAALRAGDTQAAYRAAADSGVTTGADGAEAEFYAGWLALTRMKDPKLADMHFTRLQAIGASPITLSRAYYWRGRAAEAMGDPVNAQLFYADAARYPTAFYGQLAAAKAGMTELNIGRDPEITAADRARFEDRSSVRAARMLAEIGAKDTFANFVIGLSDDLPSAQEAALLVDLTRGYGEQYLSMKVVRNAAKHGFILPERGYPLHAMPSGMGPIEAAYVLGITRQESGFDPHIRSPAGATGMMQLMPGTAATLARRLGYAYGPSRLEDAEFNMQLGSAFLSQLVDQFDGSLVMATAAYNAGPGRPGEWAAFCGDPRSAGSDPADYIECIPFSETRDYVMRVMEGMQVYRARLAGGVGKLTLPADLRRGAYGHIQSAALTPIGGSGAATR